MDCEICGQENASKKILMEGQKLVVCSGCVDLGEEITQNIVFKPTPLKQQSAPSINSFGEFSLIDGFGKKIQQARQQKKLSIKELSEKIFERESFLHKIEMEKHVPDEKLAKKIEKFLEIKITE